MVYGSGQFSAYRSVHIHPAEHAITGLRWHFPNQSEPLIMCDTQLPFGSCTSVAIFNRITQALACSLRKDGHYVVVYLVNFFVCGPDFDSCKATFDALIMLLHSLGFQISCKKIVDPCQRLAFLEEQINTMSCSCPSSGKNFRSCSTYSTSARNTSEHHTTSWNHWLVNSVGLPVWFCWGKPTSDPFFHYFVTEVTYSKMPLR